MKRFALCTLFALLFVHTAWTNVLSVNSPDRSVLQIRKFNQFYQYLNRTYVDTVDNQMLIEEAIKATLAKLDPHSAYISADEMKSVKESMSGSFSGIGIEFNILNDTLIVVNVITGGPSEKVGLKAGDRIVSVNNESVIGIKQTEVPKLLRGPKGSQVLIEILRHGVEEKMTFDIRRDNIPIETIDAAYKIDARTGYIKVNRFARNTYMEFAKALDSFGRINSLIIDLRNNGGGLLDQAVRIANIFLPANSIIVSTEGGSMPPERIAAPINGSYLSGRVIVLINESSASASEIVAGAIQDWDRGLIIGRRSFGKGLVQKQIPLVDGSAVRITTARYHTPTGRVIQRPFKNGQKEQYYKDLSNRIEAANDTINKGDDSLRYSTLRSKRVVYGGGGIFPDIYVKADTSAYSKDWSNLVSRGIINDFVINYVDENRQQLQKQYDQSSLFIDNYQVSEQMLTDLYQLAKQKGVTVDTNKIKISENHIKIQIKALIAQKLWDTTAYFKIINSNNDPIYKRALEAIDNWSVDAQGVGPITIR